MASPGASAKRSREQVPGRQWCVFPIAVARRTERCVNPVGPEPIVGDLPPGNGSYAQVFGRDSTRPPGADLSHATRSEEHTSELQSLMRISYAVFCLKTKKNNK